MNRTGLRVVRGEDTGIPPEECHMMTVKRQLHIVEDLGETNPAKLGLEPPMWEDNGFVVFKLPSTSLHQLS